MTDATVSASGDHSSDLDTQAVLGSDTSSFAPQGDNKPAAGMIGSPFLSGNEAIDRAAKQAKHTAGKNLPPLEGLPVSSDTANLRQGPSLHDGLLAVLPLVGVWQGEGQADTAEDGPFPFGQRLTFSHDGGNYLCYESRIWRLDDKGEPAGYVERENGFIRVGKNDELEFILTHSTGVVEVYYGDILKERAWQFESALTTVTTTGPKTLGPGKRLYGLLPTNDLGWVDERVVGETLHPRMSAQLQRIVG